MHFSKLSISLLFLSLITACGGNSQTSYTVSTTVRGLDPGKTVITTINGTDSLTFTNNTSQSFSTALANGSAYSVAITSQPEGQICDITNGSGTSSSNVQVSINCQRGFITGPFNSDIYGNTSGGAFSNGTETVLNFGSWSNIMQFFNPPTPTATTTSGRIDSSGLFTPGPSADNFSRGTTIFVNDTEIGHLEWVDDFDQSRGLTLARQGYYSGPVVGPGTLISGFNGWITLTPITDSVIVWSDSTTTPISGAQINQPFRDSQPGIMTTLDVSGKTFPATVRTSN